MKIILSLDIGTSKICALAVDVRSGAVLDRQSVGNDTNIQDLAEQRHEQDPGRILVVCVKLLAELIGRIESDPSDVEAICVTGQMHGLLLVDADLQPVTKLITWRDGRSLASGPGSLASARQALDESAPRRLGCFLQAGYGGATLHWLAQNGGLRADWRALSIADYMSAALAGVAATDPSGAAGFGLFNLAREDWDPEVLGALGIPLELLPSIRPSGSLLGTLRPSVARRLGIESSVKICSSLGDNQASVIGARGLRDDVAVVNLGTGGQISVFHDEPDFNPRLETRPMPFGGFIQVGASLSGGGSYDYLRLFFSDVVREICDLTPSKEEIYSRMNEMAARALAGAQGLKADTRFNGSRNDPNRRGSFSNIDGENLVPANLVRAVMEGVVEELAELARSTDMSGARGIVASGNMVRKNLLVLDMMEECFDLPCSTGPTEEEAALGMALVCALGLGMASEEELADWHPEGSLP